jgi:hypothetical protein
MNEERHALWELIGAINWISEDWESGDLAAAVRHATELAVVIAAKFPQEPVAVDFEPEPPEGYAP